MTHSIWPEISALQEAQLQVLLQRHRFSVVAGDLMLLEGKWYVTHSGLLSVARRRGCRGIHVQQVNEFCNAAKGRWTFKATVFRSLTCKGFTGFGDADVYNVSPSVHGAELRIAETRAVNRALRKAYGIGICSVEEIGAFGRQQAPERPIRKLPPKSTNVNGNSGHSTNENGTRVRDRLCQLIRHHKLDAELVKSYAIDFCGTKTLRDASREQVEDFVAHLGEWAAKDRNALLCQLNSYARQKEGAA